MRMHSFVRLPSKWILSNGLKQFSWKNDKSDNTAALMALVGIAHHTDQETGVAKLTYVEIGHRNDQEAEIMGGLKAGQTVIMHPGDSITDGSMVQARESDDENKVEE